jgi:hypothetical protein
LKSHTYAIAERPALCGAAQFIRCRGLSHMTAHFSPL